MVNYVDSLTSLASAGFCQIPCRAPLCLSLAIAGVVCVAMGLALLLRADVKLAPYSTERV